MKKPFSFLFMAVFLFVSATASRAGCLERAALQRDFELLAAGFDGRVGICAADARGATCINADRPFSLQSVMKLVVGLAVMDAVDNGKFRRDTPLLVQRDDLSLYVQPLAKLVGEAGYRTAIGDLVRRAIVDSDSAAADILVTKLGGPDKVQEFLNRKGVRGLRIDRDERHLQTEIVGLRWRPEYVDAKTLDTAIANVSHAERTAAYRRYQADPRDTATPHAMASLLQQLAAGRLLSPASTKYVMDVMAQTVTFPDRLKAGVPNGWTIGHKTGTSGSWEGVTAATNDVGVLTAPDGGIVTIAAFIGDSRAPSAERAALMAKAAAATTARYGKLEGQASSRIRRSLKRSTER